MASERNGLAYAWGLAGAYLFSAAVMLAVKLFVDLIVYLADQGWTWWQFFGAWWLICTPIVFTLIRRANSAD